jgi:hypothetical protein
MSLADLAAEVRQFGEQLAQQALPEIGPALRQTALSSTGIGGLVMGQTLDALVNASADTVAILPVPAGPWSILESGSTKRQWWEPAEAGGKRLLINGSVRIRVLHGPIRGRQLWTQAQNAMSQQFFEMAPKEADTAWEKVGG